MKYDMDDLAVLIPVRVESLVRLENLLSVVRYLQTHFSLDIKVWEADAFNNQFLERLLPPDVEYKFIQDEDPVFYRTRYINDMVVDTQKKFVAIWDADVVFPVIQVHSALETLRTEEATFVYPYDGIFLDTSPIVRQMFIESGDVDMLWNLRGFMHAPYGTDMRGGAFLANREAYIKAGMENENFYGWGPEDWERIERWKNLDYRIKTIDGVLFHLTHPRDMNGKHNSEGQRKITTQEKDKICFSSAEEIRQHLNLKNYLCAKVFLIISNSTRWTVVPPR